MKLKFMHTTSYAYAKLAAAAVQQAPVLILDS